LTTQGQIAVPVPVSQPFDGEFLLAYLGARELAGIEEVGQSTYRRSIRGGQGVGTLSVDFSPAVESGYVSASCSAELGLNEEGLARLVTDLIDGDAPAGDVQSRLRDDPALGSLAMGRPGIRIPGTVDPYELAVRAILGQQVSVAAARTFAERVATRWGEPLTPAGSVSQVFPAPEALENATLEKVGISRARAGAVRTLAGAIARGDLDLGPGRGAASAEQSLLELKGIGPWTASYVALRGLGDRDAMPLSDLGLRQALGVRDSRELQERAEGWRPLRGYAAALLWSTYLPLGSKPEDENR
jgi:AraC family transcriptional regulator, regulatory protein of adaptative response / DNA-3-methyladenine glycosylase II